MKKLITSESVSYGHPDKMADQISDALLDEYLAGDPQSKVGIETLIKDNIVVLGGEVTSRANVNVEDVIKRVLNDIPFSKEHNLSTSNIKVINLLGKQSPEINSGVWKADGEIGAGDQGLMFGYATKTTPNYMPVGIYLAKKIVEGVVKLPGLGPDAKSQVTMEIDKYGNERVHTILVSTMHSSVIGLSEVQVLIANDILQNNYGVDDKIFDMIKGTDILINPAGSWHIGGPVSDCGVTGRKIVVDQYGPYCPVGGGAFSGKDPSKVDRSAAYLARYIAKNIVAAGILSECTVELAYMIGIPEPVSIRVEGKRSSGYVEVLDEDFVREIMRIFPMTPKQIIKKFSLDTPIYYELAKNGHFGFNPPFIRGWEALDKVKELNKYVESLLPF